MSYLCRLYNLETLVHSPSGSFRGLSAKLGLEWKQTNIGNSGNPPTTSYLTNFDHKGLFQFHSTRTIGVIFHEKSLKSTVQYVSVANEMAICHWINKMSVDDPSDLAWEFSQLLSQDSQSVGVAIQSFDRVKHPIAAYLVLEKFQSWKKIFEQSDWLSMTLYSPR